MECFTILLGTRPYKQHLKHWANDYFPLTIAAECIRVYGHALNRIGLLEPGTHGLDM